MAGSYHAANKLSGLVLHSSLHMNMKLVTTEEICVNVVQL